MSVAAAAAAAAYFYLLITEFVFNQYVTIFRRYGQANLRRSR